MAKTQAFNVNAMTSWRERSYSWMVSCCKYKYTIRVLLVVIGWEKQVALEKGTKCIDSSSQNGMMI